MLYTLIAFVMIGIVLYFASPRISSAQDKAILDQTVKIMEDINTLVTTIGIPGNKRLVELTIKKGELKIDAESNLIIFEMDTQYQYSELDQGIEYGGITSFTEAKGDIYTTRFTSDYSSYDLTYQDQDIIKTITKSSSPYKLFITNKGSTPTKIDFELA